MISRKVFARLSSLFQWITVARCYGSGRKCNRSNAIVSFRTINRY